MLSLPGALNASRLRLVGLVLLVVAATVPVAKGQAPASTEKAPPKSTAFAPTAAQAGKFISPAANRLLDLWIKAQRADWLSKNFITDDTEGIAADAEAAVKTATADLARQA